MLGDDALFVLACTRGLPCLARVVVCGVRVERRVGAPAEHEVASVAAGVLEVLAQQRVEHADDDAVPFALFGLGVDFALEGVPAGEHLDSLVCEFDVFGAQRAELAEAQARVERRRPQHGLVGLEGFDQPPRFVCGCNAVPAADGDGGQPQPFGGVDDEQVVGARDQVEVAPDHPRCVHG